MDWPLSALSLLATWLVGSKRRWAWLFSGALLVAWSAYFWHSRQYGLLASDLIGIGISIRNYLVWEQA